MGLGQESSMRTEHEDDFGSGRVRIRVRKRKAVFFLRRDTVNVLLSLTFPKGIAPITVVTYRDRLKNDEDYEDTLNEVLAATGSYLRHTFFISNYTGDNEERNPEIQKMAFDILDCALINAERAVKIMKLNKKRSTNKKVKG